MLGEFEYLVIAAICRLEDDAYGASIRRLLAELGRPTSIGALYTTLDRLEAKGLITTWMGEATQARGGRSKRMVQLTGHGRTAASEFYSVIKKASHRLDWAKP